MPNKPIANLNDVPLSDFGNGQSFQARLGRIGPLIGSQQLGVMLHKVPAGKRAFPKHAHHVNEELIIVLEGHGTYSLGCESWAIGPGDVIAAPAGGAELAHQVINSSESELVYLCVSTNHDPDVVEYPESGKFGVVSMVPENQGFSAAKLAFIGRRNQSLDYFDGEN